MPHVVILLMVFFVQTAGADRPPATRVAEAPEGTSLDSCQATGAKLIADVRRLDGVSDAEFTCVVVTERQTS